MSKGDKLPARPKDSDMGTTYYAGIDSIEFRIHSMLAGDVNRYDVPAIIDEMRAAGVIQPKALGYTVDLASDAAQDIVDAHGPAEWRA